MKKFTLLLVCFISSFTILGQNNFQNGTYVYSSDLHKFKKLTFYKIENKKITHYSYNNNKEWVLVKNADLNGPDFKETSIINKNNALATWINTCDNCVWTETQTTNFFYLGNPFIYKANHKRSVNNNTGEDCFDNKKCFETNTNGYLRLYPNHYFFSEKIMTGGKSSENIAIENIRITSLTTEITLSISTRAGTLNPPSSEKAYTIKTNSGKEFKLLNQFGWGGDKIGGFGFWEAQYKTERKVILFFEPMSLADLKAGFSLKEGLCTTNCWNFYDITVSNK